MAKLLYVGSEKIVLLENWKQELISFLKKKIRMMNSKLLSDLISCLVNYYKPNKQNAHAFINRMLANHPCPSIVKTLDAFLPKNWFDHWTSGGGALFEVPHSLMPRILA